MAKVSLPAPDQPSHRPALIAWFTGFPGNHALVEDTIRSFEEICDGGHDHLPEQALDIAARHKGRAFMYVGPVEKAVEKARTLQA